jgi:hypothetical protein
MPPCGTTDRQRLRYLPGRARQQQGRSARRFVTRPVGHRALADLCADAHRVIA